jgi:hypothetical protein
MVKRAHFRGIHQPFASNHRMTPFDAKTRHSPNIGKRQAGCIRPVAKSLVDIPVMPAREKQRTFDPAQYMMPEA